MSTGSKKNSGNFDLSFIDNVVVSKGKRGKSTATPSTRVKTMAKKRKCSPVADHDSLEDLSFDQIIHKQGQINARLISKGTELSKELEDLKRAFHEKELALEYSQRCYKTQAHGVETLRKEKAFLKEKHSHDILKAQKSAALSVYQCRIAMAQQAADKGITLPEWDITDWENTVKDLKDLIDNMGSPGEEGNQGRVEDAAIGEGEVNASKDVERSLD